LLSHTAVVKTSSLCQTNRAAFAANDPTSAGKEAGTYVANERYKSIPGAVFRFGNLPAMINADVHSGEDVILTATGPGSDRVRGQMDNTEVFRIMVEALGLGSAVTPDAQRTGNSGSGKPPG
jgi:alkaline phosphatase